MSKNCRIMISAVAAFGTATLALAQTFTGKKEVMEGSGTNDLKDRQIQVVVESASKFQKFPSGLTYSYSIQFKGIAEGKWDLEGMIRCDHYSAKQPGGNPPVLILHSGPYHRDKESQFSFSSIENCDKTMDLMKRADTHGIKFTLSPRAQQKVINVDVTRKGETTSPSITDSKSKPPSHAEGSDSHPGAPAGRPDGAQKGR